MANHTRPNPAAMIAAYMANYMPGDSHLDYARRMMAAVRGDDVIEVEHLLTELTTAASQITLEAVSVAAAEILTGEASSRYLPALGWDPEDPGGLAEIIIHEARHDY